MHDDDTRSERDLSRQSRLHAHWRRGPRGDDAQFRAGGNAASRNHAFGWRAEAVVAEARREVADLIGAARPRDVIFTSGATESNNTVVRGVAAQFPSVAHVITTAIEHPSILEACLHEQRSGRIALTVVPVDTAGVVSAAAITEAIRRRHA
ncbi:MAG: aminotransferase class V-fold PLP-dependent enzyme [Actinomycetales bacterium]|uniref:Aminotransferase class V-fold PLP-dependent enzyme n=1 Tax=Candidatus Phosphoribacter hodrii TaxID=2953743 RepID=A0A9D7T8Y0_9MICO|nr:aminotransferase class V-fold PLP-dependent enzyme [Candidatus Phosphoribacter hodrii]